MRLGGLIAWDDLTNMLVRIRSKLGLDQSTQYFTPVNGATMVLTRADFVYCLMKPAATIAGATITIPLNPLHNDEIVFATTQTITSLAITGLITGTLSGGGFLRYKYNSTGAVWFRIG